MIKAYAVAEAGTVQPFAYFQLVFVAIIGPDALRRAPRRLDHRRRRR